MKARFILPPIALLFAAQSVAAATIIVSGNTTGAPTYRRVLVGAPPTNLSAIATATPFEETPFSVSADGNYTLLVT